MFYEGVFKESKWLDGKFSKWIKLLRNTEMAVAKKDAQTKNVYTKINGKGFTEWNLRGNINAARALMTST